MSLCSNVLKTFCRVSTARINVLFSKSCILRVQNNNFNPERCIRKNFAQKLKIMKVRRKIAGPDSLRKKSNRPEWNMDAELYGFCKRLHENITDDTLRCVFIHDSYIRLEEEKRQAIAELQEAQLDLKSNAALVSQGKDVMSQFILRYLRVAFPLLPEEGIIAVHDFLTSDEVLSHISSNLGTKDLIFCAEYPPSTSTFATTFRALVGAIANDDSVARAENFVLDFVCPQLIGKDVFEIWEFDEPLEVLSSILRKRGLTPTESRLIFESGRNSIEAVYHVGLYSNRHFFGRGVGETLHSAEEMAAYDALRRLFCLNESRATLPLGERARTLEFKSEMKNNSLVEMCGGSLQAIKS